MDDRYSPLLLTHFRGELDIPMGEWFEATAHRFVRREAARGRKVVHINDASGTTRTSPEMRKFWADATKRAPAVVVENTLANVLVLTNPMMRGVITAVGWLNPEVAALKVYSSRDQAIEGSLKLLEAAGTQVTLPLGGYVLPVPPAKATGS